MDALERFFQRGLKLSHLRLLTLFARLGQVRLVAETLHVTQPAVSRQLAELEAGVGTPVLTRVGNRLQFTATGEALLKRAREVLLQLEQARHEVDALSSGIVGAIAVGAVATVLPVVAPEFTLQIKRRAPNVNVSFFEATSDKLFPMLAAGALDFVFSRMDQPGPTVGLTREYILDDPIVVVCGTHHPLAFRRDLASQDLAGMPWILPPQEAPAFLALSRWMELQGLAFPSGCVQSISMPTNEVLLKRYPFIGLMPSSLAHRGANKDEIKVLGLQDASFLGKVWLFRSEASVNPVIKPAMESVADMRAAIGGLGLVTG